MRIPWQRGAPRVPAVIEGPAGIPTEIDAVLDTGADVVMISESMAVFLGDTESAPEMTLYSVNSRFRAKKLVLSRVGVGRYWADHVSAICGNFPTKSIRALLGLSWIANFRVTFDKKGQEILIE